VTFLAVVKNSKHTDPSCIFSGGQDPQPPGIYAAANYYMNWLQVQFEASLTVREYSGLLRRSTDAQTTPSVDAGVGPAAVRPYRVTSAPPVRPHTNTPELTSK